MTAATTLVEPDTTSLAHLRPLNMRRDLMAVADLVELCFADSLDADGRRYVRQMRAQAHSPRSLGVTGSGPYSLGGFVWEEDGRIVGNLNMVPVFALRQRAYLIANVAVHPDYRRRGIARALTQTALDEIQKRGVRSAWLQVKQENPAAVELYLSTGFSERARRTTWHSDVSTDLSEQPLDVQIAPRQARDWPLQRQWLRRLYPGEVAWHLPINLNLLRPGLSGVVTRLFSERQLRQWAAYQGGQLIGALAWQSSNLQADWLWLAAAPEHEALAVQALLLHAHRQFAARRTLAVDYPTGHSIAAFRAAGFHEHVTLIWMHRQVE